MLTLSETKQRREKKVGINNNNLELGKIVGELLPVEVNAGEQTRGAFFHD